MSEEVSEILISLDCTLWISAGWLEQWGSLGFFKGPWAVTLAWPVVCLAFTTGSSIWVPVLAGLQTPSKLHAGILGLARCTPHWVKCPRVPLHSSQTVRIFFSQDIFIKKNGVTKQKETYYVWMAPSFNLSTLHPLSSFLVNILKRKTFWVTLPQRWYSKREQMHIQY